MKYADVLNQEILYVLTGSSANDSIIIYNINMEETEISLPFDYFNHGHQTIDGFSYLPDKIFDSISFSSEEEILYIICPDKLNNTAMQNAKLIMNKSGDYLYFKIPSKILSATLNFSGSVMPDDFDYEKILSKDNFLKYTTQKRKLKMKELHDTFDMVYAQYKEMFEIYDSLNDEDKLKLELTGKLDWEKDNE